LSVWTTFAQHRQDEVEIEIETVVEKTREGGVAIAEPGREDVGAWLTSHAHFGIGLLMGSPFPDGTALGALDIDRDEYVRDGRVVLGDPPSGRIVHEIDPSLLEDIARIDAELTDTHAVRDRGASKIAKGGNVSYIGEAKRRSA
jgi:hypothetical protein